MHIAKWIMVLPLFFGVGEGSEVLVNTQDGRTFVFEVDPNERVGDLQDRLCALTADEAYIVSVPIKDKLWEIVAVSQGGYLGYPRNYTAEVTPQESADIRFIVTTLADKSLMSIAFIKGDLEMAGDRIDHLHPLRFLMTLFNDEEMKVGVRNIRGRGWIWNQFCSGVKDCLYTEASIGNLRDEYICHFAATLKIDVNKIYPYIVAQNWDGLIDTLIREIPRKGDHDRYDN